MEIGKVTIHDVANALNINSSKVSRALNDSPRVTKKKDKFFKTARQMGYQRNLLAANLRRNVINTIGAIAPRIASFLFLIVIQGVEETAYKAGYNVIIC